MAEPASPCTGACRLDAASVCAGCGRHINEIIEWRGADAARKHEIVAAARERLSLIRRDPATGPARP